ncbi:MAG: hypothetical protein E7176_00755 [Erysipelotrichaceae bacterium]|nr:hypothetical protein [Erysipelotrichaceae bacterium]
MTGYNMEYHKALNRSHILPNLLNGAKTGVLSQFIADIVLSTLLYNEAIVIKDIQISSIASYYAAVASGALVAFLSIYMDPFAVVLFSTVAYAFVFNLVASQTNQTEFTLRPREIVFDAGVSLALIYAFDPVAHNQYLRYQEKRHLIEPIHQRMDRSITQSIFFIVLVNTYGFLKITTPK